ncbi:MAG: ribonuclease HII [Candidatus Thermoplasmatota archaeon]
MPRGPVIGPLVVAGVKVRDDKLLIQNNVRDSKKIAPKRREFLAKGIKKTALKCETLVIPASDIDDMRKVMTMNEIEVNAFVKIVKGLKPDICYVDSSDVNEERFKNDILSGLSFKTEIVSKHKADDIYPVVGAASIIAKTTRDAKVREIEKKLRKKLDKPLGSGYPSDQITREFLEEWMKEYGKLPPYTRRSWNTAKKLVKKYSTKSLDEF